MRDNRRQTVVSFQGGLDLESPPLKLDPGAMIDCRNFECDTLGGYTLSKGYERFDGRPSPTGGADAAEIASRRAAIAKVPGSGPIRGVWLYKGNAYAFRDNVAGDECKMYVESATGWTEIVTGQTLAPEGRYQFVNYNFQAGAGSQVMIGTDGKNKAFVYDGTDFTPINVEGEDTDFPLFCAVLNNYLFLAYEKGYLYYSAVGVPTDFTSASNAGGLGTGDFITGIDVTVGGALAVRMRNSTSVLYGNGPSDWVNRDLRNHDDQTGSKAYSALTYNQLFYLDDKGLTAFETTQAFGNFRSSTISSGVTPFLMRRIGSFSFGYVVRGKNQLRWVFDPQVSGGGSDVLTLTFSAGKIAGYSRQAYSHQMVCGVTGEDEAGQERVLCGTADGWVMRMETGTSFDGEAISARFQSAFNHIGNPSIRKHFLKGLFQVTSQQAEIRVKPVFDYGSALVSSHRVSDIDASTDGGIWDESNWNEFNWSAQIIEEGFADIAGTGRNISWIVTSNSATNNPFTISECLIHYTVRNWQR